MKFILTRELGRLARWLRILGYDTLYFKEDKPSSLIIEALRDDRIILTRNRRLSSSGGVRVILIEKEKMGEQIPEVLQKLGIEAKKEQMFSRCILCNSELASIDKEKIRGKVPEYVFKTQDTFFTCPQCQRIYWQGTHWGNVENTLKEMIR